MEPIDKAYELLSKLPLKIVITMVEANIKDAHRNTTMDTFYYWNEVLTEIKKFDLLC